ncbi:ammonia permease [Lentilactobacillus curieae]|uniref:Ammonium transporter n=1 Tax=Lentilactobacillus curieae TaxID=1138822 RepID=A0A1S6QHG9_9LACO|nr:ammonium transporter [Lentilactobacillus curieae]AQW21039.1 ammonia permease [Lentilactobacillus curieae]
MSLANTSFVILSSILVLFMTPGLAFFYGGLVSKRNVVNTMLSVFIMTGVAILLWIIVGYSLSFSGDHFGFIGDLNHFFMHGFKADSLTATKIPESIYSLFQMMFAIITPALFVGAVVGRIKFNFLLVFLIVWSILVYYPMVHMVWSTGGILAKLGTLDFAGGTVVHINAGVTAFVLSAFLGKRIHYGDIPHTHYNLPWVLLGTAILWIGWYGFNAGSALAVNNVAVAAVVTTTVSTGTAMVTWMILDMIISGKPTLVGVCTGTLCGLVGITPAAGFVTIPGAFAIGILATLASYFFVSQLKDRIGIDDALDAFGCHGISGIVGSIATGLFATKSVNPIVTSNGLFYGGGWKLLGIQITATLFTIVFVIIACSIIIKGLSLVMPMRVNRKEEELGLDKGEHGEEVDYTIEMSQDIDTYRSDLSVYSKEFRGQIGQLTKHSDPD